MEKAEKERYQRILDYHGKYDGVVHYAIKAVSYLDQKEHKNEQETWIMDGLSRAIGFLNAPQLTVTLRLADEQITRFRAAFARQSGERENELDDELLTAAVQEVFLLALNKFCEDAEQP